MQAAGVGEQAKGGWLGAVILLTGAFLWTFLARLIFAPLLPELEATLGFSHAAGGSLFLCTTVGYVITVLCSGLVSSRLGHRRTIMLSLACGGVVLLAMSRAPGIVGLFTGAFFLGVSAGFYLPSGLATLAGRVPPTSWGRAMAIHELAPNLSFVTAPLIAQAILAVATWREVPVVLGLACLAWWALFWRVGPRNTGKGTAPSPTALKEMARITDIWLMAALFAVGVGGALGVYAMLPVLMVSEHGLDPASANFWLSMARLAGLVAAFGAGWATDRLGARTTMMAALVASGLCTVALGLASPSWFLVPLFLQSVVAVCFFPAGMAAVNMVSRPETRSLAVSLVVPAGFLLGGGVLPAFIGFMAEGLGMGGAIAAAGCIIACGAFVAARLNLAQGPPAGRGPQAAATK